MVEEGGIPPRREKGVEVFRLIPVVPDPTIEEEEEVEDYDFLIWQGRWGGTYPEYKAFAWLAKEGYEPGIDFIFQSSQMGGRQLYGGAVVDFDFPWFPLAWRIQGEHWHIGNPATEGRDAMQKLALTSYGYTVVDIYAQDVVQRTDWVLENAIQGIQVRTYHEYAA